VGGERKLEQFAVVNDPGRIEVFNLRPDLCGESTGVEVGDPSDSAAPRAKAGPCRWRVVAERCDHADAGDGDPALLIIIALQGEMSLRAATSRFPLRVSTTISMAPSVRSPILA